MYVKDESQVDWENLVVLSEDSETGLRWLSSRLLGKGDEKTVIGSVAGSYNNKTGYYHIGNSGVRYSCHRIVWFLKNGPVPVGRVVDHKDGVKTNNSPENLRVVSTQDNSRNRKMQADNTSGHTGVYYNVKRWGGNETHYWMASWIDGGGIQRTKCFRVDKHGFETAKTLAVEHRQKQIVALINEGLGYSERHGVE